MSAKNIAPEMILDRLAESSATIEAIRQDKSLVATVADITKSLVAAFRSGHKVLLCGNGGSAADAQHITAEFVGRFNADRDPLPAIALTVNTSTLTAVGNDYSFEDIFARQVRALGQPGDILVGISTSGNSENVLHAIRVAKEKDLTTVAFTGACGGKLLSAADYCLRIPSENTPRIQEGHIISAHIICELVEQALFPPVP